MLGPATLNLSVIDPCNRTGKIVIPMAHVNETKGVADYLRTAQNPPPDAKDLSLCLLFQKGRCNAGARCNQVHADATFIESLRARAAAVKSCCALHGDVHSAHLHESTLKVHLTFEDGTTAMYAVTNLGATGALEQAMRRNGTRDVVRLQATRICRLHMKGGCKFGKDCKNIHLCPNAKPMRESVSVTATPVATPPPTPASSAATPQRIDVGPRVAIPALGLGFRSAQPASLGISNRCTPAPCIDSSRSSFCADSTASKASSEAGTEEHARSVFRPMCASALSITDEFRSLHMATDPLDIPDDFAVASAIDFNAFVNALVECDAEELESPCWVC